nr:MAG TPA: hypothetical protein [Caudoviricetes sp.]
MENILVQKTLLTLFITVLFMVIHIQQLMLKIFANHIFYHVRNANL